MDGRAAEQERAWSRAMAAAQDGDAEYAALLDQMVVSNSPYELAGIFAAQSVITPGETRGWLIRMLDVYRLRPTNGVGQHRLATWPTSL